MDLASLEALTSDISPALYGFGIAAIVLETLILKATRTPRDVKSRRLGVACGLLGFGVEAVVHATLSLGVLFWVYSHRIWDLSLGPTTWLLCFFVNDAMFYVSHRAQHRVRLLWAVHLVHHSAKHYDLTTGVRGSALGVFATFPFYFWIPLLGIHPLVFLLVDKGFKFYGLAYHTEAIRRMGPLEAVLVTPSNHRVHHATNEQYLDRNYGGFFCIFDRLLGTFVPEEEPCVYGLKKEWHGYNLLDAQVHELRDLWRDMRAARGIGEALQYALKPPGWAPEGATAGAPATV